MLMMMSSFAFSSNGQNQENDVVFSTDTIEENKRDDFNSMLDTLQIFNGSVVVPFENIIWANAIYFNQLGRLNIYQELVLEFQHQISNYEDALDEAIIRGDAYKDAYENTVMINDKLRESLRLEKRRSIAIGGVVVVLVTYIIIN